MNMRFVPMLRPPDEGAQQDALWFVVRGSEVLIVDGDEPSGDLLVAADSTLFLGTLDGRPCWGASLPDELAADGLAGLRGLYGRVEEAVWTVAGRAVQLAQWERTHRYCGRCGAETHDASGERAKSCPRCRLLSFPRLAPAVITVVTRGEELLLARNTNFPRGLFSAIAGFVEPGETLEDAVRREVHEEVGIQVGDVRYFASQPWPFPHSLMIGFIGQWSGGEICCDQTEIAEAAWFRPDQLPNVPSRMSIARHLIDAVAGGADR